MRVTQKLGQRSEGAGGHNVELFPGRCVLQPLVQDPGRQSYGSDSGFKELGFSHTFLDKDDARQPVGIVVTVDVLLFVVVTDDR